MKALFVHDTRFFKYANSYYSTGIDSTVLKRYLNNFESITVCGREILSNKTKPNGNLASIKKYVCFANIEDKNAISIWGHRKDRKHIHKLVSETDFVIARLDSIIGFIAIDYAKRIDKPYMIELCTDPWDCYINYGLKGKILAPFITYKTKSLVKNAPAVVYVTNEYLQKQYPTRGKNIGISNVECNPNEQAYRQNQDKYTHFNDTSEMILGTAGALLPFKGQRYVIEAIKILKDRGINNIKYRLAGKGSDKDLLFSLAKKYNIEDRIEFLGTLNAEKMQKFYESLTVYIQPSLQEGLPRAVIEAMSNGLFCLGSRTAGTPELLSPERIFENKNPKQIADMVQKIDSSSLLKDSERNFKESYKYEAQRLFEKRVNFINQIINCE